MGVHMWQKVSELPRGSLGIQGSVAMHKQRHMVSSETSRAAILHRTGIRWTHVTKGRLVSLEAGHQGQFHIHVPLKFRCALNP